MPPNPWRGSALIVIYHDYGTASSCKSPQRYNFLRCLLIHLHYHPSSNKRYIENDREQNALFCLLRYLPSSYSAAMEMASSSPHFSSISFFLPLPPFLASSEAKKKKVSLETLSASSRPYQTLQAFYLCPKITMPHPPPLNLRPPSSLASPSLSFVFFLKSLDIFFSKSVLMFSGSLGCTWASPLGS